MSSEGSYMSKTGRVTVGDVAMIVELGDGVDLMFSKPTELDRDQIDVVLLGTKENITATVNSKTILGALKALEAGHDRRKVHEEGRERWQNSMQHQQ